MFLELQQQSLLIGRKPSGFTQHYYTEWDDGLGKEKISLFLALSIKSTQVPGDEIGKEAFQLLQDHFLDDLSGDPYDRFENALREVNVMVNEKEKDLGVKFVPNVDVVCGVIQKDMLFLTQRGDAQGYLVRQRHVSSITDGLFDAKNKEDLFQNIASGVLEVGDSVVIVTGQLVQYVTPNDLSKIFSEQSLEEAGMEIKELLHGDLEEQMALLAFEILEKAEQTVTKVDEVIEEEFEIKKEEKENRIANSLAVLRDWVAKKERFAFLRQIKHWEKKKLLTALGVVFVVFVLGVVVLRGFTSKQRVLADMESKLMVAEENITQAETRGAFDKDEATLLLDEAEALAIEVIDSGFLGGQASQLLDRVGEQRDYLDNVVRIDDELTLLADFTDVLGSATIVGIAQDEDKNVVFTETEAYDVLLGEIQSPNIIDAAERVVSVEPFADKENIVLLTEAGSLIEYEDGNSQFADTADLEWKNGNEVTSYSTKLYILDPEEGQIWKYQSGTYGFGSAQAYVDSEVVDLSGAVSMGIDGNVWVLLKDGTIMKLLSGEPVDFSLRQAPMTSFAGATKLYTELETSYLYVLDPVNDRILTFTKSVKTDDLTYNSQYVFDDLKGELVDIYLDKDRNVLVIATERALYELSF